MKRTLVVVSDLHAGSTVALSPPENISLSDGGVYQPSKAQKWLYQNWVDFWGRVKLAHKKTDWLGFLLNGDLVDGTEHHGTFQVISRDPGVQTWILRRVMEPALALKPDWVAVVRGTSAHVGEAATPEESFARGLRDDGFSVPQDPGTRMYSFWDLNFELDGVRISATHHGRMSQMPWLKAGAISRLAAQITYSYIGEEERRPHLAFRSHFHTYQDSHDAQPVRVLQTPAWQLHTAYGYRVVPEVLADIGGLIVTLEDGLEPVVEKVLYRPKRGALLKP